MKKFMFVTLATIMILTLSAFNVPSAFAAPIPPIGGEERVLIADLNGPAIDGVVPFGKAEFVAFQGQTSLFVGMFNLTNLPDGTCLDIAFGRTVVQGVPVIRGGASLFVDSSVIPSLTVRPGELITISIGVPPADQTSCLIVLGGGVLSPATSTVLVPATGTVILSGTFQDAGGSK